MGDTEFLKTLGTKIRTERRKSKLGFKNFAKLVGIHYSSLCDIELGKVGCRIMTLKRIADVLKVDIKVFL